MNFSFQLYSNITIDSSVQPQTTIITLNETTNKTQRQIADTVGVSQAPVYRIIRQDKKRRKIHLNRAGKCERKRKTTANDDTLLIRSKKRKALDVSCRPYT